MRLFPALAFVLVTAPALASTNAPAQAASPSAPAAKAAPPAPASPAVPVDSQGTPYNYNADGRRDPFQSLLATGGGDSKSAPKTTAAGIAGIRVDELSVRGIMQSRERLVAMVEGPDNRTYVIHQGDKLADGVVKIITPQGLVLVQDVSDPRAKDKTREVRKLLRSPEDEKEQQ
jgi:Tfp pilus assembly protein PilP